MKIKYKLILGFLAVALIISSISIMGFILINENITEIIDRENPKVQAILEMEINVKESAKDVEDYMELGLAKEREEFKNNVLDFHEFNRIFMAKIRTDEEKDLNRTLIELFDEHVTIGKELFILKDDQTDRIEERRVLLNEKVEVILDDKLQKDLDPSDPLYLKKQRFLMEMEINIHELISAVRGYILKPDAFLKDRVADSSADFELWQHQYKNIDLSSKEKKLSDEITGYFNRVKILSTEIIELEDKKLKLLYQFEEVGTYIDDLLDDKLDLIVLKLIKEDEEKVKENQKLVLYGFAVAIILALIFAVYVSVSMSGSLVELSKSTEIVSKGDLKHRIAIKSRDEIGNLSAAFNEMTARLQNANEETAKQNWLSEGLSGLGDRMLGSSGVPELADIIIRFLSEYMDASMGALYMLDKDSQKLNLAGSYALNVRPNLDETIGAKEGLAGQSAHSGKMILMTDVPPDYVPVSSALGEGVPLSIVVTPFIFEDSVLGVIELAAFREFSEKDQEFLHSTMRGIAIALDSATSRSMMEELIKGRE